MYLIYHPAPFLQPYIQLYWFVHASSTTPIAIQEHIFVDGRADIVFNFGTAYQRQRGEGDIKDQMGFSNIDGQRTYPLAIVQQGDIHLIGVRFQPGGLSALMPMGAYEMGNQTVPIGDVFGKAICVLEGQLYDAQHDTQAQLSLLNAFFMTRLNTNGIKDYTRHVARQIEQQHGDVAIALLAQKAGYSIRSLNRHFRQVFGYSPKFYARLVRFQRSLVALRQNTTFTQIALSQHYYDQAHFTKDFLEFTGQTPSAYRHMLQKRDDIPPNLVQFLQDG